jgi:mannitol/fructose-specific phosphotransferase system IIA component (Ntr-type)
MLIDHLTPDRIRLQVPAADWREAVRASGELLVRAEICLPRYIEAMLKAVEDMGPYMVIAPGIALAHARPEDGVLKVGISLVNLATPVEFGADENDPVYLVIAFGGIDHSSHIQVLSDLAEFLSDEKNQALLKTATHIEQVLDTIQAFSPPEE